MTACRLGYRYHRLGVACCLFLQGTPFFIRHKRGWIPSHFRNRTLQPFPTFPMVFFVFFDCIFQIIPLFQTAVFADMNTINRPLIWTAAIILISKMRVANYMTEIRFLSQAVEYFNLLTTGGSWSPTTVKLKKMYVFLYINTQDTAVSYLWINQNLKRRGRILRPGNPTRDPMRKTLSFV